MKVRRIQDGPNMFLESLYPLIYDRFTVLVVVYIVGGILFQKCGRGAKGKELLPNYAFWSDFPMLIKVGESLHVLYCIY